ncbi:MAG: hypothetical protein ACJ76S_13395 [Solirubrobacteraceae bacterium]|jgi:hypothetical protein
METPEQSPDDLREETEQGGHDDPESGGEADQRSDDPENAPDQDSSAQTGAEQGRGF